MTEDRVASSRSGMWIGVATVVHAAALVGLLIVPPHRRDDATAAPSIAATEIAIALDGEPAPAPTVRVVEEARVAREETSPVAARAGELGASTTRTASSASTASSPASGASSSEPMSAPNGGEGPPSGGGVVPIPLTAEQLGIAGQNPFLPRSEEKMPVSGPDHPAARAMRGTGLARDRELGLGPEGPVVRALADATTSSLAPLRGRAVFLVRAGGDGLVSGIDVIDSEGGSGWLDAGKIALEKLRGKKLAVPRGAKGMNMRIEVLSEMKVPSGQDAPFGGRLGDNKMPEMTIPDPSDLGAKPRRVVHSRVVTTEVL